MRAKSWLRVHTSIISSRKVQTLPPALFKWLVNLWAVAGGNDGILPSAEDIAWMLHCKPAEVQTAIRQLTERNLLDDCDGVITPHDWSEWQYESGSSTDRVRRHREKQKANGGPGPAAEAPPDVDQWVQAVCDRHPKVTDRTLAEHALAALAADPSFDRGTFDDVHRAWCATDEWREKNGRFAPKLANWVTDRGFAKYPDGANRAGAGDQSCLSPYPEIKPLDGEAA